MSTGKLFQLSGIALLIGSVLIIVFDLISVFAFQSSNPQQFTTAFWLTVQLLIFLGWLLVGLCFPAILLRQRQKVGWLGLIGYILLALSGTIYGIGNGITNAFALPWLARNAPTLFAGQGPFALMVLFMASGLAFVLGAILLGWATMRAGVFSRWAGLLLIVGGVLGLGFVFPSIVTGIIGTIGLAIFFLGILWMSYQLAFGEGASLEQVQAAS
jgi:hypothetical protein